MKHRILILLCALLPMMAAAQKTNTLRIPTTTKPATKPKRPANNSTSRTQILNNLVKNMVTVEGGTFRMGATEEQGNDAKSDEKPAHQVTVSTFQIGKYEVTQREWRTVMGTNPSEFKGDNLPVDNVSWDDCQQFITKLNQLTGKHFRLPTEAEWEYAARGGNRSQGYKYAGSNTLESVAWFGAYSRGNSYGTNKVGTKAPNELGLYDMTGNVSECVMTGLDGDTTKRLRKTIRKALRQALLV